MSWVNRMAFTSGLLYIALVMGLNLSLLLTARIRGAAGIYMSRPMWVAFFAAIWCLSFWIAYLISPLARR